MAREGIGGLQGVVVANGRLTGSPRERAVLANADFVVAADGGAARLAGLELNRVPDVVLGDFDSLLPDDVALWERLTRVRRVPVQKDETDSALALSEVVTAGCQGVTFLGVMGGRLDHELANVQLLVDAARRGLDARLVDGECEMQLLVGRIPGNVTALTGRPGEYVSLLPLSDRATGIRTKGLRYPLHGESLALGETRGVSNEFTDETAEVSLENGLLLVITIGEGYRPPCKG